MAGHFKLCLQVANVQHPNSLANTIPICIFNGKDTPANLTTAIGLYTEQVEEIVSSGRWHDKKLVLFLFGDYAFQTANYGLSGASGVHACLHCHCTKKAMDVPSSQRTDLDQSPRTLDTMHSNWTAFTSAGSNISNAKQFNNVIRQPILPIPVANAVVPALHLDLGIYSLLFDVFLRDVRELDEKMAALTATSPSDSQLFSQLAALHAKHRQCVNDADEKAERASTLQQALNYLALHAHRQGVTGSNLEHVCATTQAQWKQASDDAARLTAEADSILTQINGITKDKELCGPCESTVEPVLQKHNIQRQAYHGGAFIGNHVHRALTEDVVKALTTAPLAIINERCPSLAPDATAVAERHAKLMTTYRLCTSAFSHCNKVSQIHQ